MYKPGDVISYLEMCVVEGSNLQRGMNFRHALSYSVILMSVRPGAPYADRIEEDGRILIYEGHDVPKREGVLDPKLVDQPMCYSGGALTQNGLFYEAALVYKAGHQSPELVKVYEKIKPGIWVYNGIFELIDAWQEKSSNRQVFKFKLRLVPDADLETPATTELDHSRFIPTSVKIEVWKRDNGHCVICGSDKNLHFDHIIPFSKGGTSLTSENIQLLCAAHNLAKRDNIE
jgi:hypothetical protein